MTKEEIVNNGNKAYRREVLDSGKANNFVVGYATCAYEYEKRIAELEQKLEQAEKDLGDYQFNYPTIKELQKENAELKSRDCWKGCLYASGKSELIHEFLQQKYNLTKAKELLAKWVELFKPKLDDFPKPPIQVDTEQFLEEQEK